MVLFLKAINFEKLWEETESNNLSSLPLAEILSNPQETER